MTVTREDLDAGRVGFADIDSGERLPDPTPGDILRLEFLEPLGLSARALARDTDMPPNRITGILNGDRTITADTALRLAERFSTSAEFWMNLQTGHDLRAARQARKAA